ncbi:hypothetical protein [Pelagibacterium limicola]|uniref:hypothetical protein n=1 Tax=Pelagibacterium limicola TaxID=2791022 RepID=UPI0018AFA449|nr:hypothetical protein [Pelagibacterium limicola]
MPRSLPIHISPDPMPALARLDPNGAHRFEMELGFQGKLNLSIADVPRLRAALDAFDTEVMRDDGHNNRVNPGVKVLGEF